MENQEQRISFSIQQIVTEEFAIIKENFIKDSLANIKHDVSFGLDKQSQRIYVSKKVEFKNSNDQPFIILKAACYFLVNNESWSTLVTNDSNRVILPREFSAHLVMLLTGTLRGILHNKLEDTALNQFFIPTVNVYELVVKDIVFE